MVNTNKSWRSKYTKATKEYVHKGANVQNESKTRTTN